MGLLKNLIIRTAVKKAEKAIIEKTAEENPVENESKKEKVHLSKSREELSDTIFSFFIFSQFIYVFALIALQIDSLSWAVFYRSYAMAALVSCVLFLIALVAYGMYLIDFLPMVFLILGPTLIYLVFLGFDHGLGLFTGAWMNSTVKLAFSLLGIVIISISFAYMCHCESKTTSKRSKKRSLQPANHKEIEKNCDLLKTAIQENAISVRFLKRQWGFKPNEDIQFGYDSENKQFVFVNDQNSHIINYKKIVYLEYEDVKKNPNATVNTNQYERLIKMYCLGSNNKESIVTLAQVFVADTNIDLIKYYAINSPAGNDEVVFRRKIRYLASTLEQEYYPCRPFVNDEWFELLKECMEKNKNSRTNGYSLFRESVIANENYMDDATLFSIICDLSIDPPDKTSAKKEARKLYLYNFKTAAGNSIKSAVKRSFSGNGNTKK